MILCIQKVIIRIRRGTFYVTNVTKTCTHVILSQQYPRMDSVEPYIRTKTSWDFRPLICNRRCDTSTDGWLRTSVSEPHTRQQTDVYAGHTSQRRRHTEPTGPNGTAFTRSWHFPNSVDTPTYKFCGLPPITRRSSTFELSMGRFTHTMPFPCPYPAATLSFSEHGQFIVTVVLAVYSYCGTGSL
jgi:hypothetical protein